MDAQCWLGVPWPTQPLRRKLIVVACMPIPLVSENARTTSQRQPTFDVSSSIWTPLSFADMRPSHEWLPKTQRLTFYFLNWLCLSAYRQGMKTSILGGIGFESRACAYYYDECCSGHIETVLSVYIIHICRPSVLLPAQFNSVYHESALLLSTLLSKVVRVSTAYRVCHEWRVVLCLKSSSHSSRQVNHLAQHLKRKKVLKK